MLLVNIFRSEKTGKKFEPLKGSHTSSNMAAVELNFIESNQSCSIEGAAPEKVSIERLKLLIGHI